MKMRPILLLLVGIIMGMGLQAALAKEFADKIVISGAGLPHDIEISDDVCMLRALSYGNLEDPTMRVNGAPEVEGEGYLITRYLKTFTGYEPLEQVRFYHDPRGGRGYVYHLGSGALMGEDSSGMADMDANGMADMTLVGWPTRVSLANGSARPRSASS